jgi:hypothetical protein
LKKQKIKIVTESVWLNFQVQFHLFQVRFFSHPWTIGTWNQLVVIAGVSSVHHMK